MDISNKSIQLYEKTLNVIYKKTGTKHINEILKYIKENEKVKIPTKLNYLNSILGIKQYKPELIEDDVSEVKEYRNKLKEYYNNVLSDNNVSEKQKKALDALNLDMIDKMIEDRNNVKNKNIEDLEDLILLKLLRVFPMRNDFGDLYICKNIKSANDNKNLLLLTQRSCKIILNEFKTFKKYGTKEFIIPVDIHLLIKELINKDREKTYLLETLERKPLSPTMMTKRVNWIFRDLDVKIGTTILRKIYLRDKYGNVVKDMRKDSKNMMHSVGTQIKYYVPNK